MWLLLLCLIPSAAYADPVSLTAAVVASVEAITWTDVAVFALKTAAAIVFSSVLGRLTASTPKKPPAAVQDYGVMVKSAVETHKIIYGQAKVSGPLVFVTTTADSNQFLHFVIALAGHEVSSIGTIYFNDQPLTVNASGWVTCDSYPYSPSSVTQSVSSASRTDGLVTVTTGSAHGFTAGDKVVMTGQSIASFNGSFIILATPSSTTFTYLAGGDNASSTGGTAKDTTATSVTQSYARIKTFNGASDQVASSDMVAEIPGWDSNHRLQGIAYIYIRLEYNQNIFSQGIPNVSAVVKGKKVYDPRDGSTAWSTNAALCIRDYLTSDYGFNCISAEINDTYFSAAANHCDESVTLTTGGSQSRYTCNGVLDTASTPVDNLNSLISALAGTVTYVQGQFRCHAGVYDSSAGNITPDMLAGPMKIQARTSRQNLFNAVQGTYIDPLRNWQPTDFPPVTNDTYTTEDNQQIFKDIQLSFTNHPEAAQRIGKVILEQARQGILIEFTLKHSAMQYAVWDTFAYTDTYLGWDHKVFRITKYTTNGVGPISIVAQEESSSSYDWSSGEATSIDNAPDTTLPNPFNVLAPTGVAYSSRAVSTSGGDTVYILTLSWTASADYFVSQGGRYEIQFKLHTDSTWHPSFFVDGSLSQSDVLTSSVNTSYDLRIRARNNLGSFSAWTELDSCIVSSSGGAGFTLDWGSVANAVGPTNDYGSVANAVGSTNDWGSVV
jgi:hypothetical protein